MTDMVYTVGVKNRNGNTNIGETTMDRTDLTAALDAIGATAALAYRDNPLTTTDLAACRSCGDKADLIAARMPGASVSRSATTESAYISWPGARIDIRISSHTSYGANRPTHVNGAQSRAQMLSRI